MSTLNEVLRSDPNHYLALMRRSQVYKKVRLPNAERQVQSRSQRSGKRLQLLPRQPSNYRHEDRNRKPEEPKQELQLQRGERHGIRRRRPSAQLQQPEEDRQKIVLHHGGPQTSQEQSDHQRRHSHRILGCRLRRTPREVHRLHLHQPRASPRKVPQDFPRNRNGRSHSHHCQTHPDSRQIHRQIQEHT